MSWLFWSKAPASSSQQPPSNVPQDVSSEHLSISSQTSDAHVRKHSNELSSPSVSFQLCADNNVSVQSDHAHPINPNYLSDAINAVHRSDSRSNSNVSQSSHTELPVQTGAAHEPASKRTSVSASDQPEVECQPSTPDVWSVIHQVIIQISILLMVWLSGLFGLSFAWTLLALLLYHVRRMHRLRSKERQKAGQQLARDEKAVIERTIGQLPNWVYFPDAERVEWLNKVIKQLWPFIDLYAQKMLRESILPTLISYLPEYMKGLRFETIDLGNMPLRIGSIKCHNERSSRKEVLLDVQLLYAGNSKLQLRCLRFGAGVKDIQLFGQLRVRLYPLFEQPPFFGAISISFLSAPKLDFNLTSLADVLDWPGLSELIRRAVSEQLSAALVYPNAYLLNLSELPVKQLRFQPPAGVLRIELVEGRHLKKSDYGVLGLGKSDPYCKVYVAGHCFYTQVIPNTINPRWFFVCESALGELDNQQVTIEVYDQDQGSSDDFLGRLTICPHELDCSGQREYWLPLEETDTGQILIRLTWLQLSDDLNSLSTQLEWRRRLHLRYGKTMEALIKSNQSTIGKQSNVGSTEKHEYSYGSVFIILLYLNGIQHLPLIGPNRQEPNVYVNILLDWRRRRSITIENSCNPLFEQSFHILSGPINDQTPLRFELVNATTGKTFGSTAIDLWQLIQRSQLTFDQAIPVRIDQSGECELRVAIEMRLLVNNSRQRFTSDGSTRLNTPAGSVTPVIDSEPKLTRTSSIILSPDVVHHIPSLDEVLQSTVQPFVRTMEYEPEVVDDCQKPFIEHKTTSGTFESNQFSAQSGPNAQKSASFEFPTISKSEYLNISPLRFQTVGYQMLSQFQPRALITLDNLNDIYFKPLQITVHKVINLHKVHSEKCFSRVKLARYPGGRKKCRTRCVYNTNNPIYEQKFTMKHSERKPLSQLEVLIVRGEKKTLGPLQITKTSNLARTVINLTDIMDNSVTTWFELEWCL